MTQPPQPPPYDPSRPPTYPPQQPYGYTPPPPRPVNTKLAFWTSAPGIISMLAIMGVVVLVAVGIMNRLSGPASDSFEVRVTSCAAEGSTAKVGLSVKNVSKSTKSATVKIEYRDGSGNRLDTDTAYVRNIAPGDTARSEETTLLDAAPGTSARCEIVGVS